MAKGRKIEDEQAARRCLAAAKASGAPRCEWARAHGVDGRSLNAWRMNLERRGPEKAISRKSRPGRCHAPPGLVELVPRAAGRSATEPSAGGASRRYVVDVGGARVEFGDDFADATLRRVLEVLRSC